MNLKPRNIPDQIILHKGDLPSGLDFGDAVGVDTETQGLNLSRDRLCVAQLSSGNGVCHLVQFARDGYNAPNLVAILENPEITKIFHYARFDIVILKRFLGVTIRPVFCTKIASKLVRTYTDRHGLKNVTKELLGIDLSKEQQSSDWAAQELSSDQLAYAAADVLNLNLIQERLAEMLKREGRGDLATACFDFLETRGELDRLGWADSDIFAHL